MERKLSLYGSAARDFRENWLLCCRIGIRGYQDLQCIVRKSTLHLRAWDSCRRPKATAISTWLLAHSGMKEAGCLQGRIQVRDLSNSTGSLAAAGLVKVVGGAVEGVSVVPDGQIACLPSNASLKVLIVHKYLVHKLEDDVGFKGLRSRSMAICETGPDARQIIVTKGAYCQANDMRGKGRVDVDGLAACHGIGPHHRVGGAKVLSYVGRRLVTRKPHQMLVLMKW